MATEEIEVLTPISVEAEVQKYTLVGDDIYVKRYVNDNIPIWYKDLIDNVINSNSTVNSQQDAIDYLNTLGLGFSQSITSLQNKDVQIDSAIESLVTSNGANTSAIGHLEATKVTATEATAIANNSIGSYFGNEANSWFNSKISTYSSAITSNANSISTLSSSLNGANVRIDSVESVNISQENSINSINSSLANITTSLIPSLQSQIDGQISTWFYTGVPTLSNAPANTWTDNATKDKHLGDLYYNTTTGHAYRFAYSSGVYSWMIITDTDVTTALANAATAQSTADGKATIYYQSTAPTLTTSDNGDLWVNSSTQVVKMWTGTAWVDTTNSTANTAYTWSANASKLITNPDGGITGWSFGDGTNTKSYFKVYANNFSVSDGTTGYTPFSISGGNVNFNGVVAFSNVTNLQSTVNTINTNVSTAQTTANNANTLASTKATITDVQALGYVLPTGVADAINNNTTTINGSKITTGSIDALQISANAITGKTITGGVINGTSINGVNITGAVIKSSWIDYTTSGALTNWAVATDITNPSSTYYSYRNNFAKNNDGSFVVDSNGYYRLPTTSKPSTVYKSANGSASGTYGSSAISLGALYSDLYSYRSYTISTVNRVIKQSPSFVAVDASTPLIDFSSTGGWRY